MAVTCKTVADCTPSREGKAAYIFSIIPTISNGIAAITSANELLIVDRQGLAASPVLRLQDVPRDVSCLVSGSDDGASTLCSGSDGVVAMHDIRTQTRTGHFKVDRAVTALSHKGHQIAVGTELSHHQAVVSVWDQRQNRQLWQNTENNDDITALDFHPSKGNLLLAGGDDGQISIFDTSILEEDDSLLQGVNHGPIHKAGFVGDQKFFALSSDQNLSVHTLSSPGDEEDPLPTLIGDLRPIIPCEYVIDIFRSGDEYAVAAGSNISKQEVKIVKMQQALQPTAIPSIDNMSGYLLEGGHGEEVIRSLFVDEMNASIFTAGEDGCIKVFRSSKSDTAPFPNVKLPKPKKPTEGRYKPY